MTPLRECAEQNQLARILEQVDRYDERSIRWSLITGRIVFQNVTRNVARPAEFATMDKIQEDRK